MKFTLYILIISFFISQFSASIICFTENTNPVEINFNNLEDDDEENERENKETKELKTDFIFNNILVNNFIKVYKNSSSNNLYLISKYNVASSIIILPPEKI